jgi:large subunit ribosomal protein L29
MDIDKVRALTDNEIGAELVTARRHLYDLRFQLATRQLTDHSQLTNTRRSIARLLTVITERGLNENEVALAATPARTAPARPTLRRGRGTAKAAATPAAKTAAKSTATKKTSAESGTGGTE